MELVLRFRQSNADVKLHFRLAFIDDETLVPEKVILMNFMSLMQR